MARSTGSSEGRGGSGDVSIGLDGEPPLESRRRITDGSDLVTTLGGETGERERDRRGVASVAAREETGESRSATAEWNDSRDALAMAAEEVEAAAKVSSSDT